MAERLSESLAVSVCAAGKKLSRHSFFAARWQNFFPPLQRNALKENDE
jgi:hypothetical protein